MPTRIGKVYYHQETNPQPIQIDGGPALPNTPLDRNRAMIDDALVKLLNTANPVLTEITQSNDLRYRQTSDPYLMLKFCLQNWNSIGPRLRPFGITRNKISSAHESRNKGAHRNLQMSQSSNAHNRAAIIYDLQERFQKARSRICQSRDRKPRNDQRQNNKPHQNQRYQTPAHRRPSNQRQNDNRTFKCRSCGYKFNSKPIRHNNSIAGYVASSQGGFSVFCPRCKSEMEFDRWGNPGLFQKFSRAFSDLF